MNPIHLTSTMHGRRLMLSAAAFAAFAAPLSADTLTPLSAQASSSYGADQSPSKLINGSGLSGSGAEETRLHDAHGSAVTMWHSGGGAVDGTWLTFDLGAVANLDGAYELFVDGVEVVDVSNVYYIRNAPTSTQQWTIGGSETLWSSGDALRATIDDLRVYTRRLLPNDVTALYDLGAEESLPTLTITRASDEVTLSWPQEVSGWILETSADLATGGWVDVLGVVNNSVTLEIVPPRSFFRLRKAQ